MTTDRKSRTDRRREARKETLKDIIRELHGGADPDALRERFAGLLKEVSGAEIGALEQELIEEGLPVSEIRRLCDVHVRVFEEALAAAPSPGTGPGHPLHTLGLENRALEGHLTEAERALTAFEEAGDPSARAAGLGALKPLVERLLEVDKHYLRKENQLFPRLEAKGAAGPSQVMWSIHDDIRAHLKDLRRAVELGDRALILEVGRVVLREMADMINKEEKILFPMSLETLDAGDWERVRQGEEELGYAWISPAGKGGSAHPNEAATAAGAVGLSTGSLTSEQIDRMLVHLPVDISFVDENDTVLYYSATPDRIFPRSPGVIGRKVQNCHPPKSLDVVNRILEAFRAGEKNEAEFWIEMGGRFIHIRYFAMRDGEGRYRGCLEVSQDVTGIRALHGQRRLLDWAA